MCVFFRIPEGFKSIAVGELLRRPRIGEKIPDPGRVKQSLKM
jgi:hypothetical protein